MENQRLSKTLSQRGLCSRREADDFIARGWVRVDGEVVTTPYTRVAPEARIDLDPRVAQHQSQAFTVLLNKPVGYVSGQPEKGYRSAATLIRAGNRDPADRGPAFPDRPRGLAPAGRLDIDSQGLLVLTADGRVARRLIAPDSEVEKEYLVRVAGRLDEAGLALLCHGLELDGRQLKPAQVEWLNRDQLRFILREGRKRQIRRMCELVNLEVRGLKRVRIGGVRLGSLPEGKWRLLRPGEAF
ncbi:MAG: rRNA pseudouridine synthase [Gammaproteobacteria bacterium]|nr:rRNA pseudouridine synthase [Gammaproteobacteria bacterium]